MSDSSGGVRSAKGTVSRLSVSLGIHMKRYDLTELVEMGRPGLEDIVRGYGFRADNKTRGQLIALVIDPQGTHPGDGL